MPARAFGSARTSSYAGVSGSPALLFPLQIAASGRFLVNASGAPFPFLGRTAWGLIGASVSDQTAFLADTVARGYTAIEVSIPCRIQFGTAGAINVPFDSSGNAPFTKRLDGTAYTGVLSYSNINNEAPDLTFPSAAFWANVIALVQRCAQLGLMVVIFPLYVGYPGTSPAQGWMDEMSANGTTKCSTYGAFIATTFRDCGNIVWAWGGDRGTGANLFTAGQRDVEAALITGHQAVQGQRSILMTAEWTRGSIGTDQPDFAAYMTFDPFYVSSAGSNGIAHQATLAWAVSPARPALMIEEPYDEDGADGTNLNPDSTQPCRRYQYKGLFGGIAGYVCGNSYVWQFQSTWYAHINTQTSQDMARLHEFWKGLNWSGLTIAPTAITSGGSVDTAEDWVACIRNKTTNNLLLAYVPPAHSGAVTIDMTVMSGTMTARWWDPTNASYTAIGSFPNTGTQAFTVPGNNAQGTYADWVLRLDS